MLEGGYRAKDDAQGASVVRVLRISVEERGGVRGEDTRAVPRVRGAGGSLRSCAMDDTLCACMRVRVCGF